ncbi:tRNA dihydrouridine(20/20a) synthase DusA [Pelistega suis]|uniref:tRNA dihydrouridine(20/20a) synthase DusA n=1 Tax=Pelistega suis TaxID=1631957 RepID=UPI00211BF91A|nr:tRNA dihydrouridine(20/20a) synthase DusA [Pelistega suis]MCQ9328785.1 tRNA dihydrouridine(20/20a) synthase DusA [Pelistega suis]
MQNSLLGLYRAPEKSWRLSIAPMLDVTDRHCRYFHRLLAPKALLYTEMVTTGALIYGDVPRHLMFNQEEHPVALQLGGSEPEALVHCAKLGQEWGYDEINLNCGCPSERVQKGAFGACLMAEADLVADCIKAMQDAVTVPVTVKHRLGLDYDESYAFVRDFVAKIYDVGCRVFVSHARNAVLKGLSPKDNREIPPLRYEVVAQLKKDFPDALFILNGGIHQLEQAKNLLANFDGIMIGRAAWHEPYLLRDISQAIWPEVAVADNKEVMLKMTAYAEKALSEGAPLRAVIKPMLGLMNGQQGARHFRRLLSDVKRLNAGDITLIEEAFLPFC